jgi:hypothetical protein
MFWDAVVGGLKVLTHWQTYIAGLEYVTIYMIPTALAGFMMEKSTGVAMGVGCLSMLVMPLLQVAALVVFVLTLSPIILGLSHDAAWTFPFVLITTSPFRFLMFVGLLGMLALLLAFVPLLGRIQSLHVMVLGGVSLVLALRILVSAYPNAVFTNLRLWPGIWFVVGLLVIGAIVAHIATLLTALISALLRPQGEHWSSLLLIPIGAIFGFIPVFMYGTWLGSQLRSG